MTARSFPQQFWRPLKQEIQPLTALRGIGAVMVLLYHVGFFARGYLGVDLFFVLSGFVLMHAYGQRFERGTKWAGYKDFLYARVSRIYPIHLLTILLLLPFFGQGIRFSGSALLHSLLLTQGPWFQSGQSWNTAAWSLSVEWHAYLVFPILAAIFSKSRMVLCSVVGICCLVILLALQSAFGTIDHVIFSFFVLLRGIPEFLIGMVAYRFYADDVIRGHFTRDRVCFALFGALMLLVALGATDGGYLLILPGLLFACAANRGTVAAVLNSRPLQYLGEISFSLYMIQLVFETYLDRTGLLPHGSWEYDVIFVTGSFSLAILVSRYVEYPARDWLRAKQAGRFVSSGFEHQTVTPRVV